MPGSIAARTMGWQRRMGGIAGPLGASGEASNDQPVQVELLINGEWIDITTYVMVRDNSGNITITRGRRDEGSQTDQSSCTMTLDNRDGRFSPRNPVGVYYGTIGRNQTLRVSVPNGLGGKSYRFWGDVSVWPQSWDPTGTDIWTEIQGSGILRRLSQAPPAVYSLMRITLTTPVPTSVVAYWPCEDPAESTVCASALVNGSPMLFSGTPTFAAFDGFPSSDPVVDLTDCSMTGGVAKYDDPTATQVRFLVSIPTDGLTDGKVICAIDQQDYSAGATQFWELYYNATTKSLTLRTHASDGTMLGAVLDHTLDVRGKKLYVSVELAESGTGITRAVRLTNVLTRAVVSVTDTAAVTQLTRVLQVGFGVVSRSVVGPIGTRGLPDTAVGQVTVEKAITATDVLGVRLNPVGETAGRRVQRLCALEAIGFDAVGDLDDSTAMGGQTKLNSLDLMQECELADDGMLYENMAVLGLGYRTRNGLVNQDPQLILSYPGFNLAEVPTPVEDDRYIQNKVTVTVGDVSAASSLDVGPLSTQLPPAGVGAYGTDITLNLDSAANAADQAAWRVHMGTVDEARFPQISVNLAHSSFTANPALKQAVLGLRQGDRILVQDPPPWLPPDDIDQIILGFEETITHFEHRLTFICAPASPYRSSSLDADLARIDTDGSQLLTAVSSGATALTVVPTSDPDMLWTTDSAEFPFDVRMSGEVMTATSITGWLNDTFTRSVSSSWGTPDAGTAWSNVGGGSATDYAVNGTAGIHTLSTVDTTRRSGMDAASADFDIYCDITTSDLATGDSLYGAVTTRMIDSNNMMMMRAEFTTANTIIVSIRRMVGGTQTSLASATIPVTHVAGTFIRTRFQGIGAVFRAKAWSLAAELVEPPFWLLTAADTALSVANQLGTRSVRVTGNTNAVTVSLQYDNYRVVNPQTFNVTRSVNGVTKAHSAGSDIRLAYPTTLAL